jgi:hypothetical protein
MNEIKNILVPIGGSIYSQNALELAARFAKNFDASLRGLYIKDVRFFEGPWFKPLRGLVVSKPYFELKKSEIILKRSVARQTSSMSLKLIKDFPARSSSIEQKRWIWSLWAKEESMQNGSRHVLGQSVPVSCTK